MDALLAAYHHAHKYKTGRRYEGKWGRVCKAVEILLTVRDMNRFKRFCGRKDLRSYVKWEEEELYEQWFNAVIKGTADRVVYYSTLTEDEKKEYELWFDSVKKGRIDGLVFPGKKRYG